MTKSYGVVLSVDSVSTVLMLDGLPNISEAIELFVFLLAKNMDMLTAKPWGIFSSENPSSTFIYSVSLFPENLLRRLQPQKRDVQRCNFQKNMNSELLLRILVAKKHISNFSNIKKKPKW